MVPGYELEDEYSDFSSHAGFFNSTQAFPFSRETCYSYKVALCLWRWALNMSVPRRLRNEMCALQRQCTF